MRVMGLEAIYPKRRTTRPAAGHKIYPYLLRNLAITRPNQVWASDITYIPLRHGFLYLTAVMDWYSRYVLAWRLSNTLGREVFASRPWRRRCGEGRPEIFNSDQGSQFTSTAFTSRLEQAGVAISMDGRGRALDNVFVERLVAEREVRGGVPAGLCRWLGGGGVALGVLRFLLPPPRAPGACVSHAGRGVPRSGLKMLAHAGRINDKSREIK